MEPAPNKSFNGQQFTTMQASRHSLSPIPPVQQTMHAISENNQISLLADKLQREFKNKHSNSSIIGSNSGNLPYKMNLAHNYYIGLLKQNKGE